MQTKTHNVAGTILHEAREEVERADGKASTLLSGAGIVVSVTVGAMLAGNWSPEQLDIAWRVVWWVGAGLVATAVGCLGLAVLPRISNTVADKPALTYFNDVALLRSSDAVRDALAKVEPEERDLNQMIALSIIARRKYQWVRRAMILFAVAVGLIVLAGIAGR